MPDRRCGRRRRRLAAIIEAPRRLGGPFDITIGQGRRCLADNLVDRRLLEPPGELSEVLADLVLIEAAPGGRERGLATKPEQIVDPMSSFEGGGSRVEERANSGAIESTANDREGLVTNLVWGVNHGATEVESYRKAIGFNAAEMTLPPTESNP